LKFVIKVSKSMQHYFWKPNVFIYDAFVNAFEPLTPFMIPILIYVPAISIYLSISRI